MDEATDRLLDRFRAGDSDAYHTLWSRYDQPLRRFVHRWAVGGGLGSSAVDDVVQDTHVEAIRCIPQFTYRRTRSFFFWLCGIARKRIANDRRVRDRREPLRPMVLGLDITSGELVAELTARRSPLDDIIRDQHLDLLASALEQLPERRRDAILLRYVEDHDTPAAAAHLGVSEGAFRVLLSRSLDQLDAELARLLGDSRATDVRR